MDVFTKQKRSEIMKSVKSQGNKSTELKFLDLLKQIDSPAWEPHPKDILGKPDYVIRRLKIAFFIDGAFWHGHESRCRIPKTNKEYWINKINKNRARDKKVTAKLRRHGWSVLRIWDFELKENPDEVLRRVKSKINKRKNS